MFDIGKMEHIPVTEINKDKSYQREVDNAKIDKWAKKFRPEKVGLLLVSKRTDGKYYVIDGQHRLHLLKALGYDTAPCSVIAGLTVEQEAALFAEQEDRNPITSVDRFWARIASGDKHFIAINGIVKKCGLYVARHTGKRRSQKFGITAVIALDDISRHYGYDALEKTLNLITAAWPGNAYGLHQNVIRGVARFLSNAQKFANFDYDKASRQLMSVDPNRLVLQARGIQTMPGETVIDVIANMLRDAYNWRLSTKNKLA